MKNKTSNHINSQGSTYFASNCFGWALASSPWEAIAKLDLYGNGKRVNSLSSRDWEDATDTVMLYFIPDESNFGGTSWYAPIDKEGNPCGICLYASKDERNERIVKSKLS